MDSTLIFKDNGLPLSGSVDDSSDIRLIELKKKAKLLVQKMNSNTESRASIESGEYTLHYLILNSIVYMCICEKSFPRKLAFSYLSEISNEFNHVHGQECLNPNIRPYQFVNFDSYISKTKKLFEDARAQSNLDKLNNDLSDVKKVMTKNIEDLLYRGDSLDKLNDLSYTLKNESKKYKKAAQKINFDALIRQYVPVILISLLILFVLYRFIF
ncbi:hypothetical protein B5S33_g3730 [[Candida] boidinii]|nr:hypothetical protein B5S30_g501 [[Candida] boidinii]OWB85073.1 hypothetical protein B5S33_g3730 [[Candida] boidinii]